MNRPSYLLFKQCSKCGEILHVSRFNKSKSGKYGVRKICKECRKEISKKYRENNKECILINKKKRYEPCSQRLCFNKKILAPLVFTVNTYFFRKN